jgi:hypothetical protein
MKEQLASLGAWHFFSRAALYAFAPLLLAAGQSQALCSVFNGNLPLSLWRRKESRELI